MKPQITILINNHFDPMWRRCFLKPFTFRGETYRSYAEIEQYYIEDNIKLAQRDPDYRFTVESPLVLETYCRRFPAEIGRLRQLYQKGQMQVGRTGYAIVDSNLVSMETLIRNYLIGDRYLLDMFGECPKTALRSDAFGNSAQLPQILRGFEIRWVQGISYVPNPTDYWKGLDGSVVFTGSIPSAGGGGGWAKYAPCPACHGTGEQKGTVCSVCAGRGIDIAKAEKRRAPLQIGPDFQQKNGIATVGGEELLPTDAIYEQMRALSDQYSFRFGFYDDGWEELREKIERSDLAELPEVSPSPELNPSSTGCYVTRIETKQRLRMLETMLSQLELLDAAVFLQNRNSMRREIGEIWKLIFFCAFHDAVTGTHVDAAFEELREFWTEAEARIKRCQSALLEQLGQEEPGTYTLLNLSACTRTDTAVLPAESGVCLFTGGAGMLRLLETGQDGTVLLAEGLPPYAAVPFSFVQEDQKPMQEERSDKPAETFRGTILQQNHPEADTVSEIVQGCIQNDFFLAEYDNYGLLSVYDRENHCVLCQKGEWRPGEFVLEHDEGSPWATLSDDMRRLPLSRYTNLVSAEHLPELDRLQFRVELPMSLCGAIDGLVFDYVVELAAGIPQLRFHVSAEWHMYNQRLRVVFPTKSSGDHLYEIPGGILEREPYLPEFSWCGKNGDYPAVHWAGIDNGSLGIVILNRGTPSYQITRESDGDAIWLSLLRSPTVPTYLHEPVSYSMTDWDGMRDDGCHSFDFALSTFAGGLRNSRAVYAGIGYNEPLFCCKNRISFPQMPVLDSEQAVIRTVKVSENEDGIILRLVEVSGKPGECRLLVPDRFTDIRRLSMGENSCTARYAVENGSICFPVKPYEIVTLKLL